MAEEKESVIEYFVDQYRKLLDENMDDYIANFERYMKAHGDNA